MNRKWRRMDILAPSDQLGHTFHLPLIAWMLMQEDLLKQLHVLLDNDRRSVFMTG
jgi:hypothetical protein